jgi:carboxypeptidase Taq
MTRFNTGDVRITTRFRERDFTEGFFSTIHEMGHAVYEMGIDPALDGTPLAEGVSAGVHESQSRLWENLVGRSRAFWEFAYSLAQTRFPGQLGDIPLEAFYRAINLVRPSLIRTDADEVTYNLHIMIRFDLELEMLEGSLSVRDLPEAWRARYKTDLGVTPESDADGVLQDVHWFSDRIGGGFQGYTLGNIMSAQFFEAAQIDMPELSAMLRAGEFQPLHEWLGREIYRHGSTYPPADLLERVVGSGLDSAPLIRYLRTKYGELYGLD